MTKLKHIEIEININDKNDVINRFCKNKLDYNLEEYIYKECFKGPLKKHITLNIKSKNKLSIKDQNDIVNIIRSSYGHNIRENLLYLKYDRTRDVFLFLIGIVILLISKLIDFNDKFIISEILLIIGWVSIWEATYNFIFDDNKRRIRIKRYKKLTKCKINFI